jgi:hypothetical protein
MSQIRCAPTFIQKFSRLKIDQKTITGNALHLLEKIC